MSFDYDDREYYRRPGRDDRRSRSRHRSNYDDLDVDVDVRVRDRSASRNRGIDFLREDRRAETGALVLRQREVEEITRPRRRSSPSPVRIRERPRSPSRVRVVERIERRSPSPIERDRVRIVRRRESSSSSSPSPQRKVVKGPVIEREVITHYTDIDHGVVRARPPSPPPPVRSSRRDTEIDIDINTSNSRGRRDTDIDIDIQRSRSRARSSDRRSSSRYYASEREIIVDRERERDLLRVDDHRRVSLTAGRRRAHSAAPMSSAVAEEAEYITSKIDARGRIGEAYNGATRNWTIVDVPPGTERVRMDGVGGGSAEVTWQRYNGVRRSKFIPERDGGVVIAGGSSERERERERDRLSVSVDYRDREIDIEKVTDRRVAIRPPPPRPREMWTEITKDLVVREAIEELGYEYEETEWFFYIMDYLRYEDVQRLVIVSDDIRRHRRRVRDREWEVEWDHRHRHGDHDHRHHHHWRGSLDRYEDDRVTEREVVIDHARSRPIAFR